MISSAWIAWDIFLNLHGINIPHTVDQRTIKIHEYDPGEVRVDFSMQNRWDMMGKKSRVFF